MRQASIHTYINQESIHTYMNQACIHTYIHESSNSRPIDWSSSSGVQVRRATRSPDEQVSGELHGRPEEQVRSAPPVGIQEAGSDPAGGGLFQQTGGGGEEKVGVALDTYGGAGQVRARSMRPAAVRLLYKADFQAADPVASQSSHGMEERSSGGQPIQFRRAAGSTGGAVRVADARNPGGRAEGSAGGGQFRPAG